MNKAQLVEAVAKRMESREAAAAAVDAVLDAIVREVTAGGRVSVTGFGSFEKVDRPARYARNPQTGERVRVKRTSVPRFRPGQNFKDLTKGEKKLPKDSETAVKKAPKRQRVNGVLVDAPPKKAVAKKTAPPKKSTARATTAKKATSKRATAKRTTKKTTTTKKVAAKRSTSK